MTHMFNQASELYDESLKLIQQYQRLSPKNGMYLPGDIKRALLDNYHQFPEEFKEWVLGWIYHWYFER